MTLKTSSGALNVPEHTKVVIRAEGRVSVLSVDDNGEYQSLVASSNNGVIKFRTGFGDSQLFVKVQKGLHWSYDFYPIKVYDPSDPVPKEPPESMAKSVTLEDKLKSFISEMVAVRS